MDRIRILIADDNQPFRNGLKTLLLADPDLEVIGEASSGDEVIRMAQTLQPDIILMDLKMPGINGIEATRRILTANPHIRILMLTMFEEDEAVFSALRAGALGYLLKGALKAEILRAIRSVSTGEAIFGPAIAKRLILFFSRNDQTTVSNAFPELTQREREILDLIAQHRTNPEIAERLHLSSKTVRNHVSNILSKLQVANRAQAIIRAREAGMGKER